MMRLFQKIDHSVVERAIYEGKVVVIEDGVVTSIQNYEDISSYDKHKVYISVDGLAVQGKLASMARISSFREAFCKLYPIFDNILDALIMGLLVEVASEAVIKHTTSLHEAICETNMETEKNLGLSTSRKDETPGSPHTFTVNLN